MQSSKDITESGIEYEISEPPYHLSDFVENFWMVRNTSDKAHEIIVLPDGRFDIIFSFSAHNHLKVMQMGLETKPKKNSIPPKTVMFAVSFRLSAIEYLLQTKTTSIINDSHYLTQGLWGITKNDLNVFENFCKKISNEISILIKTDIDIRKKELFNLIYCSNGSLSVKQLSERVFWSSRQINRYFNNRFGISLKAYCNILRFKTSLYHIVEGKLFPEENFTDQTHFIKEVKKSSGVVPKELFKNKNDRFILLSALQKK